MATKWQYSQIWQSALITSLSLSVSINRSTYLHLLYLIWGHAINYSNRNFFVHFINSVELWIQCCSFVSPGFDLTVLVLALYQTVVRGQTVCVRWEISELVQFARLTFVESFPLLHKIRLLQTLLYVALTHIVQRCKKNSTIVTILV